MWVQKQKNGKYQLVERYTDEMTGKQRKVSVSLERNTPQSRKMAEQALIEKMSIKPSQGRKTSLKSLVDAYREDQRATVKQSTYKRNYFACNTLMEILGTDTLVDRLTANYVRRSFLATHREPGTLNELLTRFRALMRWGYRNDLINDVSFLDKLEPFKDRPYREKIQDKFLEAGELAALLGHMKHPVWKLLTEFLALSGLRVGEAVALAKTDVDLKKRLIHVSKNYDLNNKIVTTPKTRCSIRDVFIQDELLVVCKEIRIEMMAQQLRRGYRHSTLFLEAKDGRHINYCAYNKYLRENALVTLGREITPHVLRHTHASLLMELGISIDTISRRLGHENSKITREIYLHVTEKLKEKDNEKIKSIKIMA